MQAAVIASTCCCTDTNCDCPQYEQLTVTWSGSLTIAGDCPGGCDTGGDIDATVTYSGIEVTVVRVEGTGNCSYAGTVTITDTSLYCDASAGPDITTEFYATVYYNSFSTRWEVGLYVRTGYAESYPSSGGGSCGWYTGGSANALASIFAHEPSGNADYADCPELAVYTNIGGSSCSTASECTSGVDCCGSGSAGRLEVASWTTGTLEVS